MGQSATGGPHPSNDPDDRLWPLQKLHGFTVSQVLEAFRDVHGSCSASAVLGVVSGDAGCRRLGAAVQGLQAHPGLGCCKTRRMVGGQSQRCGVKELPGVPGIGAWGRGFWGVPRMGLCGVMGLQGLEELGLGGEGAAGAPRGGRAG